MLQTRKLLDSVTCAGRLRNEDLVRAVGMLGECKQTATATACAVGGADVCPEVLVAVRSWRSRHLCHERGRTTTAIVFTAPLRSNRSVNGTRSPACQPASARRVTSRPSGDMDSSRPADTTTEATSAL